MSWIDRISDKLIITTGDGKKYYPSWLNASKTKEYNVAEFNFPEVSGTLVKRSKPMGRKYSLELFFQGEDHLNTSEAFEKSADNERPWTLEHPFYGIVFVQPTSLNFDNTAYNVTKVTGTVIETITEENPLTTIDTIEQIQISKANLDETLELTFTETPTPNDINVMDDTNTKTFNLGVPVIELPEEFEEYSNLFNTASSYISTATASPLLAIRATIAALSYPSLLTVDVKTRINLLTNQFEVLRDTVENLTAVSSKKIYQTQAGTLISAMCVSAATPLTGNYMNSKNVLNIIDILVDNYDAYLEDLDTLQSPNGGNPLSFVPTADSLIELNNLFNLTIANLYDIALNSRTERSIITEKDTNIILLTHRLYGLDPDDQNINELMENNNMGLNEILQVKKGRKIVYYI